ncbi:MAG: glycosyltransferase [Myxococcales bacterium]|nr:glycosyltransferase [Myxococcales bacterium]
MDVSLPRFPPLPTPPVPPGTRPARVCLVTNDLAGPIRNGGIGTACRALAEALAAAGQQVTVLYCLGRHCEDQTPEHWIEHFGQRGIALVLLPEPSLCYDANPEVVRSYEAYRWLRERSFDVVHFHDWRGLAFYSVLARHQGLAFAETLLCVTTHSPVLWHKLHNLEAVDRLCDLEVDHLERQSVELADVVISPSAYMLGWLQSQGWRLPRTCYVQPNVLPRAVRAPAVPGGEPLPVRELVFFGRLEPRKGLVLFCDALERLPAEVSRTLVVTFLGKDSPMSGPCATGAEYVRRRGAAWPFRFQLLSDRSFAEAVAYLRGPGRLAVMASLAENSPYTVLECLGAGVPFVASSVGGIPELIRPEDRAAVLFSPTPAALAERLQAAVRDGARRASPAVDAQACEQAWVAWHRALPARLPRRPPLTAEQMPLVSVCLTHHERPQLLRQAVESLRAQTYPHLEVVLVDDGSRSAAAQAYLAELEPDFARRGWRIVRQPNRYLGAARNEAVRHARGHYLLFMDDDNCARPHEVSVLVQVALRTGADILTCLIDLFSGEAAPDPEAPPLARWLPLGGCAAVGLFRNCFGDANALVRREVFEALGGFTEDYGVGHEDWEFFARAVLRGYRLQVVPEPLYHYRVTSSSMLRTTEPQRNHLRSLRPYLEAVPPELRQALLLTQGMALALKRQPPAEVPLSPDAARVVAGLYALEHRLRRYPRLVRLGKRGLFAALDASRGLLERLSGR